MLDMPGRPDALVLGARIARVLPQWLLSNSGNPFVTYIDQITGERTELSVATVANWSSKTANLLQFELSEPYAAPAAADGTAAHVHLRTAGHWAAVPTAIAAWRLGLPVNPRLERADAGPAAATAADSPFTVAYEDAAQPGDLAVGPHLGGRLSPDSPATRSFVQDVLGEPDDLDADVPRADAIAIRLSRARTEDDIADLGGLAASLSIGTRRLLLLDPVDSVPGLLTLAAALLDGASLVILRGGGGVDAAALERIIETERVSALAARRAVSVSSSLPAVELPDW